MKKITNQIHIPFFMVLNLLMGLSLPVFSQEVTRPRFLVDSEPIPYVINVDGTLAVNSESVPFSISLADARIDALPVPIINNGNHLLLFGGGFMSEKQDTYANEFMGAYASIFVTGNLGDKFYYQTYQSVGLFGYESVLSDTPTLPWKYFQFSFVGYKWSPRVATDLGVMFISNFGKPVWIPLVQATFSLEPFIIDLALPLSVSIRYLVTDRFHILAKASLESTSYQLQNTLIQFNKPSVILQAEFNVIKWFWIKAGMEYEFQGDEQYQGAKMVLPEAWKIYAGLEMRVGN